MEEISRYTLKVAEVAQLLGIGDRIVCRLTTYPYSDSAGSTFCPWPSLLKPISNRGLRSGRLPWLLVHRCGFDVGSTRCSARSVWQPRLPSSHSLLAMDHTWQ